MPAPAWKDLTGLHLPPSLAQVVTDANTLATAAKSTLDTGSTALQAAQVYLLGTASPQAAAAQVALAALKAEVNDLFGAGLYYLTAHPWTPGLGQGEGVWRHLAYADLLAAMVAKFDDPGDWARPSFAAASNVEVLVVAVGAPSPSIFLDTLAAINTLLEVPDFALAERRVRQAMALEHEQWDTRATGPKPPYWDNVTVREMFPGLLPVEQALMEGLSVLEGYAAGATQAVNETIAMVAAKKAQMDDMAAKLAAAQALLNAALAGGGIKILHAKGAGGNEFVKSAIVQATNGFDATMPFCAALVAMTGVADLSKIKTILGA